MEDETLACGTGIVASALIFAASENSERPHHVCSRGAATNFRSVLRKSRDSFRNVTLTGPAEFVFEGTIEI